MAVLDKRKEEGQLFTRHFDRDSARAQFRVSLFLVVAMALGAFVLGFALPVNAPAQKAMPVATDGGVFPGRLVTNDDRRPVTIEDGVTTETKNIGFILLGIAIGGLIIWLAGSSKSQKPKTIQAAPNRDHATEKAVKSSPVSMEIIACSVVLLTVLAFVVQALLPDFLNGAMLPLATTTWFILYRLMANRIQGRA